MSQKRLSQFFKKSVTADAADESVTVEAQEELPLKRCIQEEAAIDPQNSKKKRVKCIPDNDNENDKENGAPEMKDTKRSLNRPKRKSTHDQSVVDSDRQKGRMDIEVDEKEIGKTMELPYDKGILAKTPKVRRSMRSGRVSHIRAFSPESSCGEPSVVSSVEFSDSEDSDEDVGSDVSSSRATTPDNVSLETSSPTPKPSLADRPFSRKRMSTTTPQDYHVDSLEPADKKAHQHTDFGAFTLVTDEETDAAENLIPASDIALVEGSSINRSADEKLFLHIDELLSRNHIDAYMTVHLRALQETISYLAYPSWVLPQNMKDGKGRAVGDPMFDSSHIKLPSKIQEADKIHWTPAMSQYWLMKSVNFNKVILFKVGKFYEIFYSDAVLCQRILNIKWMAHDAKPHIGFPESSLNFHAKKIVATGMNVSVVEQMETPKELESRNKDAKGPKEKAVHREICEVFTAGTLTKPDMLTEDSRYLLVCHLAEHGEECNVKVILADVSRSKLLLDHTTCKKDETKKKLMQILTVYSVHECAIECSDEPNSFIISILNHLKQIVRNSYIKQIESDNTVLAEISKKLESLKVQEGIARHGLEDYPFSALFRVLEETLILDAILHSAVVEQSHVFEEDRERESKIFKVPPFVLDQLEVFPTRAAAGEDMSLYSFLNKTSTPMGGRLLKEILTVIITDIDMIQERQDFVGSFISLLTDDPRAEKNLFKKPHLFDLERSIASFLQAGANTTRRAVYFDTHPGKTLEKLHFIVEDLKYYLEMLVGLFNGPLCESSGKRGFISIRDRLLPVLDEIHGYITKTTLDMAGSQVGLNTCSVWVPAKGVCKDFDAANEKTSRVKDELNSELEKLKQELGVQISFCHVKYKYELSMTLSNAEKTSVVEYIQKNHLSATSQSKTHIRYRPNRFVELADEYENVVQELSDNIHPGISIIAQCVHSHRTLLESFTSFIGHIDVYYAFAKKAVHIRDICAISICVPQLTLGESVHLDAKELVHPVGAMRASARNATFVPNDILINKDQQHIVLSGPNMGGKSTLLRSIGSSIMMAQIGCFVCARSYSLKPFCGLYSRIGARDCLLENKSTLLIELEETSYLLKFNGGSVLGLVDELGRGTSTYDGTAIACATLKYLSSKPHFSSVFSTHYEYITKVAEERFKNAKNYCMKTEEADGDMKLTYKLQPGRTKDSQGLLVAKFAGVPMELIQVAQDVASRF